MFEYFVAEYTSFFGLYITFIFEMSAKSTFVRIAPVAVWTGVKEMMHT